MKVTAQAIEKIIRGMDAKKMSQTALAEKISVSRSYISRILKGDYQAIPHEQAVAISDALEISLLPLQYREGAVSATALHLTQMADEDPAFSSVLEALMALKDGDARKAFLPSVDTEHLAEIGAKITQIVMRWEDAKDPHYAKIAVETLSYLRDFYGKGKF